MDQPLKPEKEVEKRDEQAAEQQPELSNLQREGYAKENGKENKDVQRVGDSTAERPKDAGETYQTVFTELAAAKKGMLNVNEVIRNGGGPYSQSPEGRKAYQDTFSEAQSHYMKAQKTADAFLFQSDKDGKIALDQEGRPIPSKENIALQQRVAVIDKDLQGLTADQTPAGREKLQQALQEKNMISDLLRSAGYARANQGLSLMFDAANLKGEDKARRDTAATLRLNEAAIMDPKTTRDPNFIKHLHNAKLALHGVAGAEQTNPVDQSKPPVDQTKPPVDQTKPPVDQTKPPVDQTKPPVDQSKPPVDQPVNPGEAAKPTDRVSLKNGATVEGENNQYYVNFGKMHVPTWTQKRPDGTPTAPFKDASGVERTDGMLKVVKDKDNNILGTDNKPLLEGGLRRIDKNGEPVRAQYDATDPALMLEKAKTEAKGPLTDTNRAAFMSAIDSADKLDRVSMSLKISENQEVLAKNKEAAVWEGSYRQLIAEQEGLFDQFQKTATTLKPEVAGALGAVWTRDKAKSIDEFLADPKNAATKTTLEADPAQWAAIKAKMVEFDNKTAEIAAREKELAAKPELAAQVKAVREADSSNRELSSQFASSVDTRAGYLKTLLEQESVAKYLALPSDKKATDPLKDDVNVKEAQRIIVELAKAAPDLKTPLTGTATGLGLDLAKAAPARTVETAKPGDNTAGAPPVEQVAATDLTKEQAQSVGTAVGAFREFLAKSEGGTKPLSKEEWDKIGPAWEAAINANASINPELLNAFQGNARAMFGKVVEDTKPANQAEAEKQAITDWMKVNKNYVDTVNGMPEDQQKKYMDVEAKFDTDIRAAQAAANGDQAKFEAEGNRLQAARMEELKKINPALATAIEARNAAMADPKILAARRFSEIYDKADSYKQVNVLRVQYAQALTLQGGKENMEKAKAVLTEALKDKSASEVLQGSQQGQKLLADHGLQTDAMKQDTAKRDLIYPELKFVEQAQKALADKTKDPKAAYAEADKFFTQGTAAIDKEVADRGGIDKLKQSRDAIGLQLGMALSNFEKGVRGLPGPDSPEKAAAEKRIRESIKGSSPEQLLEALKGNFGPEVQQNLLATLTESDMTMVQNFSQLSSKIQNYSAIRMMHAVAASEYGHKNNDQKAKDQAVELIQSIRKLDPQTFSESADFQGALKQAQDGRVINLKDDRAAAIAYSEAAKRTIAASQTGLIDQLGLTGTSALVNGITVSLTGHYISDIPYVGGILASPFGGGKEAEERAVKQEALAILQNKEEAQMQRDAVVKEGTSALKGIAGDVTGVATTFATGYGINYGLNALTALSNVDPRLKLGVAVVGGLAAGGLTNNAIRGEDLLSYKGYVRNTGGSALTYAAVRGFSAIPTKQALSEATLAKLGEKYAVEGGLKGTTAAALAPELATASGLNTATRIGDALTHRLNPLSYTPFKVGLTAAGTEGATWLKPWTKVAASYVGWGGERTAQMLASNAISLGEWQARRAGAQFVGTLGTGYMFGAGYQATKIASGDRIDGKNYSDWKQWGTEMNTAGLQTGMASALFIPIAGSMARYVPGFTGLETRIGGGVTSLLTKIGAPEAAAGVGSAALVWTQPTMESSQKAGLAAVYDHAYEKAKVKAAETEKQAQQANEERKKAAAAAAQAPKKP